MRNISYWHFIILAFIGGFIGLQEFYRGRIGLGILAVLFAWTCIPMLVGFIEGFVWLFREEENFNTKYNKKEQLLLND